MAAKKKTGRIALPYLITIFLGILIVGGGTYFFLRHLGIISGSDKLPEPPSRQITTVTYADNHTVLFILDEPEQKCSSTFMLMRSVPKDKKLVFIGIPSNTISEGFETENDRQPSLKTYYETYGAGSAVEYAEKVTVVNIADTDITAVDYRNHKVAIKNMLTNGRAIASFLILEGEVSGEDFLPSESFLADLRSEYYSYDEGKGEAE